MVVLLQKTKPLHKKFLTPAMHVANRKSTKIFLQELKKGLNFCSYVNKLREQDFGLFLHPLPPCEPVY